MNTNLLTRVLCAAALITLSMTAQAQQLFFFPNDTTIDYDVPGFAIVGYANENDYNNRINGTSPAVALITGGIIADSLLAFNRSTVNFSDGLIGVDPFFSESLFAYDRSTVNMSGGIVDQLIAYDLSTVNISGGSILLVLHAVTNSTVNFTGGIIGNTLFANNDSVINYSGGIVGGDLSAGINGTVNYSGGSVDGDLFVFGSSTMNLFGTGLGSVLTDPNASGGLHSQYTLSGTLLDGTSVDGQLLFVENDSNARFTLNNVGVVPEPGSMTLLVGVLCVGGFALCRKC